MNTLSKAEVMWIADLERRIFALESAPLELVGEPSPANFANTPGAAAAANEDKERDEWLESIEKRLAALERWPIEQRLSLLHPKPGDTLDVNDPDDGADPQAGADKPIVFREFL